MRGGSNVETILYGRTRRIHSTRLYASHMDAHINFDELGLYCYFEEVKGFSGGADWGCKQELLPDYLRGHLGERIFPTENHMQEKIEIISAIEEIQLEYKQSQNNMQKLVFIEHPLFQNKIRVTDPSDGQSIGSVNNTQKQFIESNYTDVDWFWRENSNELIHSILAMNNKSKEIIGWVDLFA